MSTYEAMDGTDDGKTIDLTDHAGHEVRRVACTDGRTLPVCECGTVRRDLVPHE